MCWYKQYTKQALGERVGHLFLSIISTVCLSFTAYHLGAIWWGKGEHVTPYFHPPGGQTMFCLPPPLLFSPILISFNWLLFTYFMNREILGKNSVIHQLSCHPALNLQIVPSPTFCDKTVPMAYQNQADSCLVCPGSPPHSYPEGVSHLITKLYFCKTYRVQVICITLWTFQCNNNRFYGQ